MHALQQTYTSSGKKTRYINILMNNYNFMLIYTNFNNNIFITKAKKQKNLK